MCDEYEQDEEYERWKTLVDETLKKIKKRSQPDELEEQYDNDLYGK